MLNLKSSIGKSMKVGIAGATGAVGVEMLRLLEQRSFPVSELSLFSSARSAGKQVPTKNFGNVQIQEFDSEAARKLDLLFLAVSGSFSLQHAEALAQPGGPIVIDNSSAFRYHKHIPLVIPEINLASVSQLNSRLIANPNCTTAIAAMALWPLHKQYGLKKVIISTYQAASGAGAPGMNELEKQMKQVSNNEVCTPKVFQHQLASNIIPHIDAFQDNGFTKEEMKVAWETRKIFGDENIAVSCTAVRVPTYRAHAEAITIETEKPITAAGARELLAKAEMIDMRDETSKNVYPMPLTASNKDAVEVGRIRQSLVFGDHGIDLFVCGDQLLRGAALNAVIIAEKLLL